MKVAIALILFALRASAGISVDSLQLFTNGTPGQNITVQALTNSQIGLGTWNIWSADADFHSWFVTSNASVSFPNSCVVSNVGYVGTGTRWMRWTNSTGNIVESMSFRVPGEESPAYQQIVVRGFMRFCNTNETITGVNWDHIEVDGNPFSVMQQQTVSGLNRIISHAGGGNGAAIDLGYCTLYFFVMRFNLTAQTGYVALYNAENGFALVGASTGTLNGSGNAWWVRFQANYLAIGTNCQGYIELGGVSFGWTSAALAEPDLGTSDNQVRLDLRNASLRNFRTTP